MKLAAAIAALVLASYAAAARAVDDPPAVVLREFIYQRAPFRSCHASTIVETPGGLVAAWFGGSDEGNKDVSIWLARREAGKWTAPLEVADGQEPGKREPCWNPVLFQMPGGPLLLFYKVGPNPRQWWGVMKRSTDGGRSWSAAERLPDGQLGPIKNKPVLLDDGRLLCGSSTEHDGWQAHLEWTADAGKTWAKTASLAPGKQWATIQPTILRHPQGKLQILCRSKQQRILESWSSDGGKTWSPLEKSSLPNNNSGIDAVNLPDGSFLLVYNPTTDARTPLSVALSRDGKTWREVLKLETGLGEFSYPGVIVAADGLAHITYTWQRLRVRHVVLDPKKL